MKKIIIVIGVCLLSTLSFFSGCINESKESTQFSIVSFDVEPNIINQGEFANLSWVVTDASSVSIDNGIGSVALTGNQIIQPTQTTIYVLTASNATTTKNATATIIVKPTQQTQPQTPNITCTIDNATDRITIASVYENLKWRDITITTNPIATWQVQDVNYSALAKPGNTATIAAYVTVGDNILVFGTPGNVTVTLKYKPTNAFLGNWTVNI